VRKLEVSKWLCTEPAGVKCDNYIMFRERRSEGVADMPVKGIDLSALEDFKGQQISS
jgi:hypothetical protein